ncbi:MAG: hypothetical protein ACI4RR_03730 [Eubacterium sp.]
MKYFAKVIIVLLVAASIVFLVSYHYRQEKISEDIVLTTQNMNTSKTTKQQTDVLITENKESGYKLYKRGQSVVLSYEGIEKEFPNWYWSVNQEKPLLFYKDYDGDGESELLIKLVNSVSNYKEAGKYIYSLFLVKTVEKADGKMDFSIISADKNTWKAPFEKAIKCEMTTIKPSDKFLQLVMDDAEEPFYYDKETGMSKNKYVGFARALKDGNEYLKFSRWSKGYGIYNVDDDGNITLDIQVLVYYEGREEPQYAGNIHSDVGIDKGKFIIVPKTIKFMANTEYLVYDPRVPAESDWSSVINNTADAPAIRDGDNVIDWIETRFELQSDFTETSVSFAGRSSQIKCVESVKFTESEITLTAADGYVFSQKAVDDGKYAATVDAGSPMPFDVCERCEIKNIDGKSVLIMKFDKTYDREALKGILIEFGN